ncbi:MAG: ABC transporter permease [Armatimonadota bacterium]|nr:MAG: ABC transporter permease [Armatimonadota bacterium]
MGAPASPPTPAERLPVLGRLRDYLIYFVFIGICLALALAAPNFFKTSNLVNIVRQSSFRTIVAVGMTFVILTAGIDLSVGGIIALSGVVGCLVLVNPALAPGWALVLGIAAGIATGGVVGVVNGVAITRFNLPPFIATLAMWFIAGRDGGLAFLVTRGRPVFNLPGSFKFLGEGDLGGIPVPIAFMLIAVVAGHLVLTRTTFGRYVYAVGGNEEAAWLSGINVSRVKLAVYTISGLLSGLSGMILAARLASGDPKSGIGQELDAIAAVVVGGTSLFGGKGTILGTLVGALIIGVLNNGLNLLNIESYWQPVVKGGVILLAVLIDQITKK